VSTSILNTWITEVGEPCTITNNPWVVVVLHCDGRVLNWSEGRYRYRRDDPWIPIQSHPLRDLSGNPTGPEGWWYDGIPSRDGHVEIEVPPGCYSLRATSHTWWLHGILYGNGATDRAIVQASCGQDVCANLFASSIYACWTPLAEWMRVAARHEAIDPENAERAIEAMTEALKSAPGSPFERREADVIRMTLAMMDKDILPPPEGSEPKRQGKQKS
jgi:hypothetical protein